MILQPAIDSALLHLRGEAEARMQSRATIYRKTGQSTQDESAGREVPTWESQTGIPFRLAGTRGDAPSRTLSVAGVEVQVGVRTGHLPAGTDVRDSDLLLVTAGENAGTVWRVVESDPQDQATARRVPIVATDRPEEWG